ncbi:SDR family oxidoreductase [Thalassospira sp. MCCC 1A01428]|uniref:SDR family oxidoreductase n=1 Tax=Thalassospira sp. MCCC 1A01428 TaxID=1470575 RepID=UPI000A1F4A74|nr:SDR family oxidoreductase [Thalassospira sp. MCCC 1A01428]OSQ42094.1 dehydrogenase [Thalassospira sp. MCCC 1A01428]
MKTVLITGCSSGFGRDTASYFLAQGWQVIATMRTPNEDVLPKSGKLRLIKLDVTDDASITAAIKEAGKIDVLVNNAGIGWLNAVEDTSMEMVRQIFETNTFGTIAMTKAVLPQFRAQGSGVIVNVTSAVTLKPLLLLAVYTASKAAIDGFTSSLALELEPFNIQARIVLPGRAPTTQFGENARARMSKEGEFPETYRGLREQVYANFEQETPDMLTQSDDVAKAIWRAATDPSCPVRLPAGADAVALLN